MLLRVAPLVLAIVLLAGSCLAASSPVDADDSLLLLAPRSAHARSWHATPTPIALIFAGGFGIAPANYQPLIERIQRTVDEQSTGAVALHAVVLKFAGDLPIAGAELAWLLPRALQKIVEQVPATGVPLPVFYGGHSRGGQLIVEWANATFGHNAHDGATATSPTLEFHVQNSDSGSSSTAIDIQQYAPRGLVLCASGLVRKYRSSTGGSFYNPQLPILSLSGELDGLFRIFRLAESYYHDVHAVSTAREQREIAAVLRPAVVVHGANHMAFAVGDILPAFVRANDLPAEVTPEQAAEPLARATSAFLLAHHDHHQASTGALLATRAKAVMELLELGTASEAYFQPIIQALELEGSYHLRPPCSELRSGDKRPCWRGSPWSERMAVVMANMTRVRFEVDDTFWNNPAHFAKINNTCAAPTHDCYLALSTVSGLVYNLIDKLDTGITSVAATEIRFKTRSRQAIFQAAGEKNANYRKLDGNNRVCRRLNQLALDYARESVPADILARFARFHGAPLAAADDAGPYNSGPSWYYTPLKFKPMKDDTGRVVRVDAVSATLRTSTRYLIPAVRGVHYCKLLSPARALEWLYTDGLRFNKGMTVVAA